MIPFVIYQNKSRVTGNYGHWYARAVSNETIDLEALAKHMSNHNTPFSKGTIVGILADMVGCIKELLLEGKNIKIDNLAIFSASIENNNGGAQTAEEFSVQKNIKSVKMNALATGDLSKASLNLDASLQERSVYNTPTDDADYSVIIAACTGGKVTATPASAKGDENVILTIVPDSGYHLVTINARDNDDPNIPLTSIDSTHMSFVMGSGDVTVTASFAAD